MTNFSVAVVGGGLGGLALAHGLRRAGITVDVYERTRERTDWLQGYRIHINPAGAGAMHHCLPPAGWQSFLDTVSVGDGGFGFLTDQATELIGLADDEINDPAAAPPDRHYGVSRIRLREVLLDGLDDVVHLGRELTRYELTGDRVTAHFADGGTATADILVGADGANSRVRGQLLPHAHRVDTGVIAVAGRFALDGASAADLPAALTDRANLVVPRGRGSLFTAVWRGAGAADHAIWGFSDAADRFPADVTTLDGAALRQVVRDRMTGWSPAFHHLVGRSDPATVHALRVRSAAPVDPWPTGRVTLLGDAIHNMTPMAGVGANTALRDADLLRRELIAARAGERPLVDAIGRYEREMLRYGFAAVRQSLRNAEQAAHSTALGRAGFRTMLRLTAAVPPLRRGMARRLGS
ncbi:NAD(P)/FAD-dependent oxidoreductase [Asanoa sp. WMMD1127]|uniref:FAD-dependent oxidoreductase n=1 Tax=Asanoa sp. WMMD1127 TaxID=3016107 RepID=UPI0024171013|nr:NAD(P)/FAD-dependent oxidoreductase [Asanoa sp. WMMD1127]MDG4827591.1 NAD(P)/FAD-dependent oxidoreductase [Asanoa sp. WMMD1127]